MIEREKSEFIRITSVGRMLSIDKNALSIRVYIYNKQHIYSSERLEHRVSYLINLKPASQLSYFSDIIKQTINYITIFIQPKQRQSFPVEVIVQDALINLCFRI